MRPTPARSTSRQPRRSSRQNIRRDEDPAKYHRGQRTDRSPDKVEICHAMTTSSVGFSVFYISFGNIGAIRICPTAWNGFTLPPDHYLSY